MRFEPRIVKIVLDKFPQVLLLFPLGIGGQYKHASRKGISDNGGDYDEFPGYYI